MTEVTVSMLKTRPLEDPYETYKEGGREYRVLKHYQFPANEAKNPYARVRCAVRSSYNGGWDYRDVYCVDIPGYVVGKGAKVIVISVTEGDIALGRPRDIGWCPIARAFRRRLQVPGAPEPAFVSVGSCGAYVGPFRYSLSAKAIKFIAAFDMGKPVSPCRFRLELDERKERENA